MSKNERISKALKAALVAALTTGAEVHAVGRCACRGKRVHQTFTGPFVFPDADDPVRRYAQTYTHPHYPETEGRPWVTIPTYLDVTASDPRGSCEVCGHSYRWDDADAPKAPAKPRKAPGTSTRKPAERLNLPRIIRFLGTTDSGEYGNAVCPHCGAEGRYVHTFVVEGGETRGAMSGCIKLFPVSPVADAHVKLMDKQRANEKLGRGLNSWDTAKLAAIEAFYAAEMTEADAMAVIRDESAKAKAWVTRRYGRTG